MSVYATLSDLEARYPNELILLAADETTGVRDDIRIGHALEDASVEVRAILAARYSAAELSGLDQNSLDVLRVYTSDIALYRVAISFARSNEAIKERHDQAIKRLEAIAAGKGALTSGAVSSGLVSGTGVTTTSEDADIGQNEVIVSAPERMFTRKRLGSI